MAERVILMIGVIISGSGITKRNNNGCRNDILRVMLMVGLIVSGSSKRYCKN